MANNASLAPVTPAGIRRWSASPAFTLLRFLAVIVMLSALACLYFWQLSNIATIRNDTVDLQAQIRDLEHNNAALMLQVAAWNRPDYIQNRANALGLVSAGQPVYMQMPSTPSVAGPAARPAALGSGQAPWWQQLAGELQKQWARITGSPKDLAQASR
jgi:hypothetical protein